MDAAVQAWLLAELGTDTNTADLATRYLRLGSARAVALEILRERLAAMRAQPTSVTVTNVVAVNFTANLAAYERQIARLEAGEPPAPDEDNQTSPDTLGMILLRERPRR
ncbi:hypothetical protein ABZX39_33490 [Streptomyces collinus]|uniref:hypothetical protein n=1 Tax=Streptomyces collinus TaxID=42684 RepID=UPI0033A21727